MPRRGYRRGARQAQIPRQPPVVEAPAAQDLNISVEQLTNLVDSAVKNSVNVAVSKVLGAVKEHDMSDTYVPKEMKFNGESFEKQFRCLEELLFYMNKAKDKFQANNHDQGMLFLEKSIALATQREKEVYIANRSTWAVVNELKAYSGFDLTEKEEHKIREAEKKVAADREMTNKLFRRESGGGPSNKYPRGSDRGRSFEKGAQAEAFSEIPAGWFPTAPFAYGGAPGFAGAHGQGGSGFPSGMGFGRGRGITCYTCRMPGHKSFQCWNRPQVPEFDSGPSGSQAPKNAVAAAQSPPAGFKNDA